MIYIFIVILKMVIILHFMVWIIQNSILKVEKLLKMKYRYCYLIRI
nr:MAG TPA: hypothetical protein [Caudoviricetes sp.]DAU59387.1 MAG TPA: hypothetical protein [Crassvirales sp.]